MIVDARSSGPTQTRAAVHGKDLGLRTSSRTNAAVRPCVWIGSRLVGCLVGCLVGWLVGRCLVGWLVGRCLVVFGCVWLCLVVVWSRLRRLNICADKHERHEGGCA